LRHSEGTFRTGDAARIGQRMTRIVPLSADRQRPRSRRPDADQRPQRHLCCRHERVEHDSGGLACGQHIERRRLLQRRDDIGIVDRALDETSGVDAVDRGTNDCAEMVAELLVERGQLIWRGSVQAESPVATSNCLRRRLTT
jgi:hypothetical protein